MQGRIVETYDYQNENGELLFQAVRLEPKSFRQRRPINGRYAWGLSEGCYGRGGNDDYFLLKHFKDDPNKEDPPNSIWLDTVKPVLYRLPEIKNAIKNGHTPYIVEGEKDANNLASLGFCSTTCPMGAGKWRKDYTDALKSCNEAIIIADKDNAGRKHSKTIAKELSSVGIDVKVIEMPNRNGTEVKDFTDWLNSGGTKADLEQLVRDTPLWKPTEEINSTSFNELTTLYGRPYFPNAKGTSITLNESFWAGLHSMENIELYEPKECAFYKYNNETGIYHEASEHSIKQEISSRILQVSRENNEPLLEQKRSISSLTNIVSHLKGISEKRNAFKKQSNYVHLGNGIVIFDAVGNSEFVSFSPSFYSRNQSPIIFNPEAKCERFLNELLLPAVSTNNALLIQKYAGLSLLGKNLPQRFIILEGHPAAGKTTLAQVIQMLVGLNNTTELRTRHLSERFELYRFIKKTLLVGVDVPGDFLSQKGTYVLKGLVGGDYFDAEQKNGVDSFQFQGNFCILITSNSRLQVKLDGDLGAWKRRLLIVRFEAPPPKKKIPNFADLLIREEGSGIMNWALQGLSMLLEDIRNYGDIHLDESQEGIVDALLAESDSLRHFLNACVTRDSNSDLTIPEIVERYAEYCPTKGWNAKHITIIQREIEGLMLEIFGISKSKSIKRKDQDTGKLKDHRGFRRVRLVTGEPSQ